MYLQNIQMIKVIVLTNNSISEKMAQFAVERDNLSKENILIIKLRKFNSVIYKRFKHTKTIELLS